MSFSVAPADLDGYGKLIQRAGQDIDGAIDFMTKNATIEDSVGDLWQTIYTPHSEHLDDAKKCLEGFRHILESSARELTKSAKYYRDTDEEQARKVDATYPQSKPHRTGDAKDSKGPSSSFADKADAGSHLKAPGGAEGYAADWMGEFQEHPGEKFFGTLLDAASPCATALELLKILTGWDPLGDFMNWLDGDWESYLNCAEVWGNLADFCGAVSQNVKAGNIELDASWQGNSADAAYAYFDGVGDKLLTLQETFNSLKEHYFQISAAVYAFAEFSKGIFMECLDRAVIALLNKLAGDACLASVGGAPAAAPFFAVTAAQVLLVMKRWGEVTAKLGTAMTIASGSTGVIRGVLAGTYHSVKDFPVPGSGGYDNRAAQ